MMDYQEAKKTLAGIMNNQAAQIYQEWLSMFLEQHPLNTEEQFKEMLSVKLGKMKSEILEGISLELTDEPSDVWEADLSPSRLAFIRDKYETPHNPHTMLQHVVSMEKYIAGLGKAHDQQVQRTGILGDYLAGPTIISLSYEQFNGILFEPMHLSEYSMCFDMQCYEHKFPAYFKNGEQKKFSYFLAKLGVPIKIGINKFGIPGYKTQKSRAKREIPIQCPVFANQVHSLLNKR